MVAALAAKYNTPIISYLSMAFELALNRTDRYTTLSRVGVYNNQQGLLLNSIRIVHLQRWPSAPSSPSTAGASSP